MDEAPKSSLLIVDDEVLNIMVLTSILNAEYSIYAAKTGQDAIELAAEHAPDVILLDILMPGMDGYEVISALKNSDKTREIPVIFVTGLDYVEDEEKGLLMGASDYIRKPFSASIVKLRVRNQIEMRNYIQTIERLSMIDQLANIPNRRGFDERLQMEWGRAIRTKTPLSIFMLDLDNFKNYNDTYGHMQGDMLLRTVAKIFSQELKRSIDYVARWGGEEFAVLLVDTDWDGALAVAERMRKGVEDAVIQLPNGQQTKVTVSIGIYSQLPASITSIDDFVQYADQALYAAKAGGKNRVCRYGFKA